jgi:hypothetical protein
VVKKGLVWFLLLLLVVSVGYGVTQARSSLYYQQKLVWLLDGGLKDAHLSLRRAIAEHDDSIRRNYISEAVNHTRIVSNIILTLDREAALAGQTQAICHAIDGGLPSTTGLGSKNSKSDAFLQARVDSLWQLIADLNSGDMKDVKWAISIIRQFVEENS